MYIYKYIYKQYTAYVSHVLATHTHIYISPILRYICLYNYVHNNMLYTAYKWKIINISEWMGVDFKECQESMQSHELIGSDIVKLLYIYIYIKWYNYIYNCITITFLNIS